MRIRVAYSIVLDADNLAALAWYCGYPIARSDVISICRHIGELGLDEQIHEGANWLEADAAERIP